MKNLLIIIVKKAGKKMEEIYLVTKQFCSTESVDGSFCSREQKKDYKKV